LAFPGLKVHARAEYLSPITTETTMTAPLSPAAQAQLFTAARSHHAWKPIPVEAATLRELYDLFKWGPTAVNLAPARFVFVTSETARERLYPALQDSNVDQVRTAPVTVIVAYDERFYDYNARLFPAYDTTGMFAENATLSTETAFRNSTLQGAYALLAARTLGLDICPMSGFFADKVDQEFFAGTTWRANFLFTLGYADPSGTHPRGPRLSFDEACSVQ
jgi:3-hydroxypropanoate dehydrogenase